MALQSDLFVNASKMEPEAVNPTDKELNDYLVAITEKGPPWYQVTKNLASVPHVDLVFTNF